MGLMLVAAAATGALAETSRGPTILTIGGEVAKPNRGAFDKSKDGLLAQHNKSFTKAAVFSRADLEALKQHDIAVATEGLAVTLRGPKLVDVLALAGAEGRTVKLFGLDQYMVELTPDEIAAKSWVLGLAADGEPLALGGRGPLWLAFEVKGGALASVDDEAKWVWAVYYIEAQ
jgi:hypothetical protein